MIDLPIAIAKKRALLLSQLELANKAVAAQNRIIQHDGDNFAYDLSLKTLIDERQLIEQEIEKIKDV